MKITKNHVKLGDNVQVISGKEKGTIGKVLSIIKKKSIVTVEGILPRIKYSKNRQGGEAKKIEIPVTIHISNVMLYDQEKKQISKIGYQIINGEKKRYFKKSGNFI